MITDQQRDLLLEQYYDRGILKKEIRSYEVSLWTLQDEFITVLKWSDIEQQGRIEEPKMTLNIDGTQKFTFQVPMYYNYRGKNIENPSWYAVRDREILLQGLRKVKVIFNKGKEHEGVFEFVIVNVTDSHEEDVATCQIEAEGLAFQELGKIGYKLSLSQEDFELVYKEWQEKGYWFDRTNRQYIKTTQKVIKTNVENILTPHSNILYVRKSSSTIWKIYEYDDSDANNPHWVELGFVNAYEPVPTLNYWCEEGAHLTPRPSTNSKLNSRTWYYTIQMNYSSFEDQDARVTTKLYEEPYATSWNSSLVPTTIESYKEKARIITAENSNLYNITQNIAEQFGVYCRYEYIYNENYQIIGKVVVFYNNFSEEEKASVSFSYPFTAERTERVTNSQDIVTKLYVLSVDNSSILSGTSTIMNATANYSQEDYILNFDYLKKLGAISSEQYSEIKKYEKLMRQYNLRLDKYQRRLATYQTKLPELEAKKTFYENAIDLDKEQVYQNNALKNALDTKDGTADGLITLTGADCDYCLIKTDGKKRKYITLSTSNKGIKTSTIRVYRTVGADRTLSRKIIRAYQIYKRDKENYVTDIYFTKDIEFQPTETALYVTYSYSPSLYYDKIVQTWTKKQIADTKKLDKVMQTLGPESLEDESGYWNSQEALETAYENGLYKKIEDLKNKIISELTKKQAAIEDFERLMGPALREGYWQPDTYTDYGTKHTYTSIIDPEANITIDTKEEAVIAWDNVLFDDEDTLYYDTGINSTDRAFYPCIDLTKVFTNGIPTNLKDYSLIWKASTSAEESDTDYSFDWNNVKDNGVFSVGSQVLFKFLQRTVNGESTIIPVLVIVGAKNFTFEELQRMIITGSPQLARYTTTVNDSGEITVSIKGRYPVTFTQDANNPWLCFRISGATTPSQTEWTTSNTYPFTYADVFPVSSIPDTRIIFPRIKFSSLQLKTTSSDLMIKYDDTVLTAVEDYYINTRDTSRSSDYYTEYYITLKPDALLKNGYDTTKEVTVYYTLSNADTSIYLDALKVSKENAFPKVEYSITPQMLNMDLTQNLYERLAQIIMINDSELKFEDVFGYISGMELNLDRPWEDTIEVKNYTTKFEDLFSSIVAQNEAMRQNENRLNAMADGSVPLSQEGLTETLTNTETNTTLTSFLDEYFDSSQVVKETLRDLFNEAGEILANANKTLHQVNTLTTENAEILSNFAQNVNEELAIKVYNSEERPESFKTGDIWLRPCVDKDGNTYIKRMVATSNSNDITGDLEHSDGSAGFTTTYDGSLASIKGAGMAYDADDGTVNIYGEHNIDIASGGSIYIGANDHISLVGNKTVNLGGSQINIISDNVNFSMPHGITLKSIGPKNNNNSPSSMVALWTEILNKRDLSFAYAEDDTQFITALESHSVSIEDNTKIAFGKFLNNAPTVTIDKSELYVDGQLSYDQIYAKLLELGTTTASIDLQPNKIDMVAAKIEMATGGENGTSVISIDATDGIWLGSNRSICLFSGGLNSGANIELNSEHILLGFNNIGNGNTTAIKLDEEQIILAAGTVFQESSLGEDHITETSLSGVQIKKDYIGMATGENTNRSIISMDPGIIKLGNMRFTGNANNENQLNDPAYYTGSFMWLSNSDIYLGGMGNLTLNTNNIKLQTKKMASSSITANTTTYNTSSIVEKMGFVLGKGLQGSSPEPAFSFWIDTAGEPHLVIASDKVTIGKSGSIEELLSTKIEGLTKRRTVREYGYFTSQTAASNALSTPVSVNGPWYSTVPTPTLVKKYYYGTTEYTKGADITAETVNFTSATLDNDTKTIRQVGTNPDGKDIKITYYKYSSGDTTVTEVRRKGDWFATVNGRWRLANGKVSSQQVPNKTLYSRSHAYTDGRTDDEYNDLREETELATLSGAARDAWLIANGTYTVPAVQSSGLIVDGNEVALTSTGKLMLLGNSEVFVGTSSSESALLLNKNGISIGSQGSISMIAGSSLTFATLTNNAAFTLDSNGANITAGKIEFKSQSSGTTSILKLNTSGLVFDIQKTDSGSNNNTVELKINSTGAIIPNGKIGPWIVTPKGLTNSDGSMGFNNTNNTNNQMAFWVNIPKGMSNGAQDAIKLAFYYKNGKVYIRDLVLYNQPQYSKAAFGEEEWGDRPSSATGDTDSGSSPAPAVVPTDEYISNNIYSHKHYQNGVLINAAEGHNGSTCSLCGQTGCYGWG